jgi:hypothetical protein
MSPEAHVRGTVADVVVIVSDAAAAALSAVITALVDDPTRTPTK